MLTVAHPWLLLLLGAPLLVRWLAPQRRETRPYLQVPFLERLSRSSGLTPSSGAIVPRGPWMQQALLWLVWGALVVALARPQHIEDPVIKALPGRDLLIAVDLSGSMETGDFTDPAGQPIDRVTAVKQVLDEFLNRREGDRVGLMFFGTAPFMQVPFTEDLQVCRALLREAQPRMAGPQTMLGDAIGRAITVFENSDLEEKVLILLADGNDTGSLVPPLKAAEIARNAGITIHTIGMGDPATIGEEKLDVDTLNAVAEATGGKGFLAINRPELEGVYREIDALTPREVLTLSHRPVRELYFWPLGLGVALTVLFHTVMIGAEGVAARRPNLRGRKESRNPGRPAHPPPPRTKTEGPGLPEAPAGAAPPSHATSPSPNPKP